MCDERICLDGYTASMHNINKKSIATKPSFNSLSVKAYFLKPFVKIPFVSL